MAGKQYKTKRVTLDNGRSYNIPVDDDGYVPATELLKRFNNRYAGVKNGRQKRDLVKDYDSYADIVLPEKLTPEQAARWWACPADLDIEGIDTPGQPKMKDGVRYHGTQAEVIKMSQMMRATNDEEELKKIRQQETVYSARPLKKGIKGRYIPSMNKVDLDRRSGMEHQTMSHETTHMMRHRDRSRKNILTVTNTATNVEESCTVAEQMARSRAADMSGYYWKVSVFDEKTRRWRNPTDAEAIKMAEEDYMILTYGRGKPLKGKDARKSVEKNWERTNIARLRGSGGQMAISSLANQDPSFRKAEKEVRSIGRRKTQKNSKRKAGQNTLFSKIQPKKRKTAATKGKKR